MADFIEYAIRSRLTGFLHFPDDADCTIFQPRNYPSRVITGRDVCYIEVEGCEVFFSSEMYGIQVVFTTANIPEEVADAIVASITEHLAEVTGDELYMVRA